MVQRSWRKTTGSSAAMAALLLATFALSCGGSRPQWQDASPSITLIPAPVACTLGDGVQDATCGPGSPSLAGKVDAAIDKVVKDHPTFFDKGQELSPGSGNYRIVDAQGYVTGVVDNLKAAGLCAQADLFNDHRVKVKKTADVSEDYNVVSVDYGDGSFIQRSPTSYDQSCEPAAFPLPANDEVPPPDQGCGQPYPPPISNFGVRVLLQQAGGIWTLDSTPRVHDRNYCAAIGYTDNRTECPLRPEGNPERVPCEGWRVGLAKDTGRLGPTWTRDGAYCTGVDSGCDNDPHNQFQLRVYEGDGSLHDYTVCGAQDACGDLQLDH